MSNPSKLSDSGHPVGEEGTQCANCVHCGGDVRHPPEPGIICPRHPMPESPTPLDVGELDEVKRLIREYEEASANV